MCFEARYWKSAINANRCRTRPSGHGGAFRMTERIDVTSHDKDIEHLLLQAIAERVGDDRFGLWFGSGTRVRLDASHVTLVVPSRFLADWIRANFRSVVEEAAQAVVGGTHSSRIVVAEENVSATPSMPRQSHPVEALAMPVRAAALAGGEYSSKSTSAFQPRISSFLPDLPPLEHSSNEPSFLPDRSSAHPQRVSPSIGGRPRVTPQHKIVSNASHSPSTASASKSKGRHFAQLDTFIEGASNHLARRAADFAIHYPGKINPIYIHGSTSVGKTHLLEAIWSESRRVQGRAAPLFLTAEQFTNLFIDSLRQGGMPAFRNKFRDISMLIVDDIPFIAGKKQTQAEFMHLIDTLKGRGVQLVFSGDRPLGQLAGLRSEIISRLEAGMVCEIKPPEPTVLFAICRGMAQRREIPVSEEVCRFVTTRLNTHARQLSGALNLLHAVHLTTGEPITLSQAEETLGELIRGNRRSIRLQEIDKTVCEIFGLAAQTLQSKGRSKNVTQPRMVAMWLARKHTRTALVEIGRYFGDRSHSTVITAQKKVDRWLAEDAVLSCNDSECSIAELLQRIERKLHVG